MSTTNQENMIGKPVVVRFLNTNYGGGATEAQAVATQYQADLVAAGYIWADDPTILFAATGSGNGLAWGVFVRTKLTPLVPDPVGSDRVLWGDGLYWFPLPG